MWLFSLRLILAISLTLMAVTPAVAASTAKAALTQVKAAAAAWQADAVLTHISTLVAKSDGNANSWLYTVYSPKAKKSAIITARDGKIEVEPDVRNTSIAPLTGDFLDSDKVLDAARKAGLKTGKEGIGLGLTTFGQATGKPRVYWTVTVTGDGMISSVTLDPKDGTLIKRDDTKF